MSLTSLDLNDTFVPLRFCSNVAKGSKREFLAIRDRTRLRLTQFITPTPLLSTNLVIKTQAEIQTQPRPQVSQMNRFASGD